MNRKISSLAASFAVSSAFIATKVLAAGDSFGLQGVDDGLGGTLSTVDPKVFIIRLIQIALSFLGLIALVIIIYAGFIWMTSKGDNQKIEKAKNILRNAVIGLFIVLASWGIVTYVISKLSNASGGIISSGDGSNNNFQGQGLAAIGACSLNEVYPENNKKDLPRNTSIMVSFREELSSESVCVNTSLESCACNKTDCRLINPKNIRIYSNDLGDACSDTSCPQVNSNITNAYASLSNDLKTIVITPAVALGKSDGNTDYNVKLTSGLQKKTGGSMFKGCSVDGAEWSFEVSNSIDLVPPMVAVSGAFPFPDNLKDYYAGDSAKAASTTITVKSCPSTYYPAKVGGVVPEAEVSLEYHGQLGFFAVSIPAGSPDRGQLFDADGNLLGIADFDRDTVRFPGFLSLTSEHQEGDMWKIEVKPEILADTLTVVGTTYVFSKEAGNNNILVPESCNQRALAANIAASLSGQEEFSVELDSQNPSIKLIAKEAGTSGNNLEINTTNSNAISFLPFSGGEGSSASTVVNGRQDSPMNSILRVNFSEAINPITISGTAGEVSQNIRVVNADGASLASGSVCSLDSQCRSYNCDDSRCLGNYLDGRFIVSNSYRTVEFVTNQECGVNGCGDKIYCLPANSHLAVELLAADLRPCESDNDCSVYDPYTKCLDTAGLSYKTCQNETASSYPAASIDNLNGLVDAANNSFDGNRGRSANGPVDFYDENLSKEANSGKGDKYKWSFFISDKMVTDPPLIISTFPGQGASEVSLADPLKVRFNTLMMSSSLRSGSTVVDNGTSTVTHKLLNLWSSTPKPFGYWVTNENLDIDPVDGLPELTEATIMHSRLFEATTFNVQVGSGVKDIYQNCYKPSAGPNCQATDENPSCCYGSPTAILGSDGNCY
jgi:hypothetical protein